MTQEQETAMYDQPEENEILTQDEILEWVISLQLLADKSEESAERHDHASNLYNCSKCVEKYAKEHKEKSILFSEMALMHVKKIEWILLHNHKQATIEDV